MKRFLPLAFAVVLVCLAGWAGNAVLLSKVNALYDPAFGNELNIQKNQGLILQKAALEKGNSIQVYGSSELSGSEDPFHPARFFSGKYEGIQYNLIGRGYCQSLIHLINFGALGDTLKDEKVVFILSPQWFNKVGIASDDFKKNFSQGQYLAFLNNDRISRDLKISVAQRADTLLKQSDSKDMEILSGLSAQDTMYANTMIGILKPYYELKEYLIAAKDGFQAYKILSKRNPGKRSEKENGLSNSQANGKTKIDWDSEKKLAQELGKAQSGNNEFGIENSYYDQYLKEKMGSLKGYMKDQSYLESPEYGDLELLLRVCQEQGIEPLFISIPVNGLWYDYCEFPREDRAKYYEKIRKLISSYGFQLADFSGHEYDQYFLRDTMHLGWKGWVEVNEAILSYAQ